MKKLIGYSFAAGLLISGGIIYATYSLADNHFGSSANDSVNASENASEESDLDAGELNENEKSANNTADESAESDDLEQEDENEGNPNKVYFNDHATFNLERSDHEDAINFKDGQKDRAKELIGDLHKTMNDIVGYGKIDTLDFEELRSKEFDSHLSHKEFMKGIMELEDDLLDDSRAVNDIRNLESYYRLGYSLHSEDRMALRYAHRIIHDLDIYVNGNGSDDDRRIWGVTEAFGDDDRIERMYDYIRDHAQ
ncbi:hypothetical protein K8O68_03880 [Salipaludibacillus sp. CUR1]|uniref:hypothetical protein n=1 Tax=Salipaludibacillus sp. CUR1 TaxID=2820003 RepID=UPI001E337D8B|nr:hypothetical protein [Salipaludibacillus sp. CUR1]MCE7791565.1 hypothetical protein [Salipaludibacillus sp. CUR1]